MRERRRVFLGLGSNVGNRIAFILRAVEELAERFGVLDVSTVYESDPWGVEDQPPFLNCVVKMETSLSPRDLLRELQHIERKIGRRHRFRWGPREIDIDILLYGGEMIREEDLEIPHPRMGERDFVLIPLVEVEPEVRDPRSGVPYRSLLGSMTSSLRPFCCVILRFPWSSRSAPSSPD